MSSFELYEKIRSDHKADLDNGHLEYGSFMDDIKAPCLGYVLQIAMADLFRGYEELVNAFRKSEPDQYYFPASDIHITVFEFVSVRDDFKDHAGNIPKFVEVCTEVLKNVSPFTIRFCGTVFTKSSGIISGYDEDILVRIREQIRNCLSKSAVVPLERYQSRSAHISFMGFREPLRNYREFLRMVEKTRATDFGSSVIGKLELVEHDWCNRLAQKRVIQEFDLRRTH